MPNNQQAQKLRALLKESTRQNSHIMAGIASNIDTTAYTCTVTRANGTIYEDVQLKALKEISTGVALIPKDGTWVHMLEIGEPDYLVIACEEADKYMLTIGGETLVIDEDGHVFDGGNNGGMVIIGKLVDKMNKIEDTLNGMVEKWNTFADLYTPGGPAVGGMPTSASSASKLSANTQISDIENIKVKH